MTTSHGTSSSGTASADDVDLEAGGTAGEGSRAAGDDRGGEAGDITLGGKAGGLTLGGEAGGGVEMAELYTDNRPGVLRSLVRSGRSGDAEDLAHDAFERTLSHRAGLDGSQSGARAYLYAVTGNLVRDRWRRERRARAGDARLKSRQPASVEGADDIAVSQMERASFREVFANLDPVSREILRLRVVEGRSSTEVAEMLGRTPASVRQIQHRALTSLRGQLEASGWTAHGASATQDATATTTRNRTPDATSQRERTQS